MLLPVGGSWQQGCPRDYLRACSARCSLGGGFSSKNAKQQGTAFYGSRPRKTSWLVFRTCCHKKTRTLSVSLRFWNWRRERDSNPRNPDGFNGFRDRPVRPLRHLSIHFRVLNRRLVSGSLLRYAYGLLQCPPFSSSAFQHLAASAVK